MRAALTPALVVVPSLAALSPELLSRIQADELTPDFTEDTERLGWARVVGFRQPVTVWCVNQSLRNHRPPHPLRVLRIIRSWSSE